MKDARLNPEDRTLLAMLAWGLPDKEIARRVGRTYGTVRVMLSKLYTRMEVGDRAEAIAVWQRSLESAADDGLASRAFDGLSFTRVNMPEFGAAAIERGLYASLGPMSRMLGTAPHFRNTVEPGEAQSATSPTAALSQYLWEGFLRGEFQSSAALWRAAEPEVRPHFGRTLSAQMLLLIDRHGEAAEIAEPLVGSEAELFRLARDWLVTRLEDKRLLLDQFAAKLAQLHPLKHVALVTLFHGALKYGAQAKAVEAANALAVEAEEAHALFARQERLQPAPLSGT